MGLKQVWEKLAKEKADMVDSICLLVSEGWNVHVYETPQDEAYMGDYTCLLNTPKLAPDDAGFSFKGCRSTLVEAFAVALSHAHEEARYREKNKPKSMPEITEGVIRGFK